MQTIEVASDDGTRISSTITGTGRPLVVVHGSINDARDWQAVADALTADVTTYAVDRRGHGASGNAREHSLEREREDVAAVLDAVGPDAVLLGHSYGGLVALEVARVRPPAALVVYEPGLPLLGPVAGEALPALEAAVAAGDLDRAFTLALRHVVRAGEDAIAASRADAAGWELRSSMTPGWVRELRAIDDSGADPARFAALGMPVLVLHGQDSPPWLVEVAERLAGVLPDARTVELIGQGHEAHLSDTATLAGVIRRFLSGVPR